jgi:hypothetical protein
MSGKTPARLVIADALKTMQKAEHRLSPEAHRLVVGKLASALKAAYPSFDVSSFISRCGVM